MVSDASAYSSGTVLRPTASAEPRLDPSFPSARELLAAIRTPSGAPAKSDLAKWAQQLSAVFDQHRPGELRAEIDDVILAINLWVVRTVRHGRAGASMAQESLGEVIWGLVRVAKHAQQLSVSEIHPTWRRLAQQALAYEDLARGLRAGTSEMPDYLPELAEIDWS